VIVKGISSEEFLYRESESYVSHHKQASINARALVRYPI